MRLCEACCRPRLPRGPILGFCLEDARPRAGPSVRLPPAPLRFLTTTYALLVGACPLTTAGAGAGRAAAATASPAGSGEQALRGDSGTLSKAYHNTEGELNSDVSMAPPGVGRKE